MQLFVMSICHTIAYCIAYWIVYCIAYCISNFVLVRLGKFLLAHLFQLVLGTSWYVFSNLLLVRLGTSFPILSWYVLVRLFQFVLGTSRYVFSNIVLGTSCMPICIFCNFSGICFMVWDQSRSAPKVFGSPGNPLTCLSKWTGSAFKVFKNTNKSSQSGP